MILDDAPEDDPFTDCVDEGVPMDGPASLLRALLDVAPTAPSERSALWRGLIGGGPFHQRADSLAAFAPESR